ncbi:AMDR_EMENI ACETAMIDASE REGULATORY PROTEIN [Aspergillus nidulans FGSC A4]|uniref:transcription factor amdR n=1 Tax=Emericella nidulans (strain FGSC A4 / ATCC 38163 / CBS 112.46 / NRRL 194 / M139) TaxID=227321 RepID=UPI0000234671|nr:transcription factor amdR [Aspergillus nidulans FGSC A4]EAA59506.1 AMDR_EMENI ACETAMIDASE REGULATORY PROTEIN [Aspergillus nidulans FGSC A4]CBF74839.1 TPA: amdR, Zn(II)2Cys6 transcription factor, Acetamidase regulatory protein (Eurofung) [Aspergillus nidulans FGSC A4]|eukprot:XP_661639.1 AMDR_EMENI ACETAMIDASE REGULATORY PROTEIN [Aspergillus nidulans FGSC A4]
MSSTAHPTNLAPSGNGSAACVHCHRRKVRCDARLVGLPCSNCRSAGKTDCQIHEKKKKLAVRSILDPVPIRCRPPNPEEAPKPISSLSPSSEPPNAFTTALRAVQSDITAPSGVANRVAHIRSRSSQYDTKGTRSNNNSGNNTQYQNVLPEPDSPPYSRPAASDPSEGESRADIEKRLVNLIDGEASDSRAIQRGVRAIYVGHELSNMSFLIRQQRDTGDDVYHFAGNEIPRRQLRTGHDQLLMDALTLPEPALADELVHAYFAQVNPGYPIVEEELFMSQYRNRDPADAPPILLLQTILLVGAHVTRPKSERDTLKDIFFRRAKWLFDNRIERNRDILVQAALLLTWHSDLADDDVSANAHYWIGIAARIATGLGMHRNPVCNYPCANLHDSSNLEDSDVSPLTFSDFEGCGARVQADFVIHFSELCTMISYIVRERFGLRISAERRKAALLEADEALANWSLRLPDRLRLRASDMDPWSAMLHLTYNNFLILLHRPHPRASAYSDDYGPHDAEICSAAAGVIASIFEELRIHDRLKQVWYSGVHTLFTAMIQVRVELRFSNPVLAINALRRFDSASYSLRELAQYWSHASTILRLFEESRRLQEDLRTTTSDRPRRFSNLSNNSTNSPASQQKNTSGIPHLANINSSDATPPSAPSIPPLQPSSQLSYEVPTTESAHHNPRSQPTLSAHTHTYTTQPFDTWIPSNNLTPMDTVDNSREMLDWRQLFSFTDLEGPVLPSTMEGITELEDEWRQIYWQETPMSDLLQDGGWMHG